MKKTTLILAALAVWGAMAESTTPIKPVEVMAVYYPHWHVYPRGEEWFGKGWTEWEFVKTPKTRFPGQKIFKPFMGYLDGKDPDDVAVEIDLASNCGIDVFLWDWYWYGGELMMQESLEQGFLKAPNRDKMKFALMWCFHERTDQFRPEYGKPRRRLSTLARTPEDFRAVIDYCIAHYFREPTYWRKNGRPFFSIYNAPDFVKSYGGPEKVNALFAEAAETMKRAGLPPVHWSGMTGSSGESRLLAEAGFDSASSYGCNAYTIPGWKERMVKGEGAFPYSELVPLHEKKWDEQKSGPLPFIPVVERGWDATYRCRADVAWPWKDPEYPYCGTITNNDVNTFEKLLREAKDAALADPNKPGAILINAWNEYTEGSWLLPDTRDDDASLRAIAAVFGRKPADKYVFSGLKPWWSDKPFKARTYTIDVPTFANLAYGPHTRQKLDVWLPTGKGGKKTPVLVNIHGGGWTLGARTEPGTPGMLKACRDRGIALVSVSYRFIQDGNDEGVNPPVAAPVSDAVAAIRYIQAHADEWNTDVTRIALTGGSAGACSSLIISLADANALGIRAVAAMVPQTSLDPKQMKEWIPNSCYGSHAFGCSSFDDWLTKRDGMLSVIEKYSPAALLLKCPADRAPTFWIRCGKLPPDGELPADPTHAGMFGVKFKELCDARGVTCNLDFGGVGILDQMLDGLVK